MKKLNLLTRTLLWASTGKPYVGGQAVIEGVMMRSPRSLAIAVRRPDGTIVVREDAWISLFERFKFLRWPFFRGSLILIESLYNGIQALNFSATQAMPEEEPKPKITERAALDEVGAAAEPTGPKTENVPGASKKDKAAIAFSIAFSLMLAIVLFKGLPHFLAWGAGKLGGVELSVEDFGFHALDGLFKISIFVGYILLISMMDDIKRVFQYHGAEHKAINTYENQKDLEVDNARSFTTFHPRCGTSFVLFVLLLSIFMFASVFPFVPRVHANDIINNLAMVVFKVPLMLPLAGIAYEINRFAGNNPNHRLVQLIVSPGRLMQKLTTREPTDDQLEIALSAMRAALKREAELAPVEIEKVKSAAKATPSGGYVTVFQSYRELADTMGTAT